MNTDFISALNALQKEKNIDKDELIEAIESSIVSAYQKNYGDQQKVEAHLDRETGEITVFESKEIVEDVEDPNTQIALSEAREIDPNYQIGDVFLESITPRDFGRIAAQNAKQLIVQRIKEAERNLIYNEFIDREGEIINGTVAKAEHGDVYVTIGSDVEALLPTTEQVPGEHYRVGERLKVYLLSVKNGTRGPQIKISRTHPNLVKRLFETEVPEIYEGTVEIVSISREPGSRTKIAVTTDNPTIDPVGACVGQRGVRVQSIINEIGGEKVDIIRHSDNIEEYLTNALSPAKVLKILPNKDEKTALAVVDNNQLSLAIGKEGQNVRLAAKLTGWKIDIKSETAYQELIAEDPDFEENFVSGTKAKQQKSETLLDESLFKTDENDAETDDLFVTAEESTSEENGAGLDDLFATADETQESSSEKDVSEDLFDAPEKTEAAEAVQTDADLL